LSEEESQKKKKNNNKKITGIANPDFVIIVYGMLGEVETHWNRCGMGLFRRM
jgi:hypothetical protein